jgi:endonuclease/exonuclease/phosphatase (EEP) superfamily protein YafD
MSFKKKATLFKKKYIPYLIRYFYLILMMGGIGLMLALAAGFLGKWWWQLELFSHFRLQYWFGLLVCTLGLVALQRWRSAMVAVLLALVVGGSLTPFAFRSADLALAESDSISIYFTNVYIGNEDSQAIAEGIKQFDPDVVLAIELTRTVYEELVELLPEYPLHHFEPGPTAFQIAAFSKVIDGVEPVITPRFFDDAPEPSMEVNLDFAGRPLRIIGIHPPPPISDFWSDQRDQQLLAVARDVGESEIDTVLGGDFNATPWSPIFGEVIELSGLQDGRRFGQVHPTWPTNLPLFMRIPIDHVLISENLVLVERVLGPAAGSDHLPVFVRVRWR